MKGLSEDEEQESLKQEKDFKLPLLWKLISPL